MMRGAFRDMDMIAKSLLLSPQARRQYEIEVLGDTDSKFGL
jgi:hypothetical protein